MNINKNPDFPYSLFPFRLEHMEGKELKDKKICFFESENHLQKYLVRSNLKKSEYQLYVKEGCGKSGVMPLAKKRQTTTRKQTKSQSSEPSSS
jgi:hypothetical protein